MDYKVTENGAAVWYKLVGDNELPMKVGAWYIVAEVSYLLYNNI
jgi:hypothetical protein